MELQSGRVIGHTCGHDACGALLWEAIVMPPEGAHEASEAVFLAWRMKKRRAEAKGLPFTERLPADLELERARWDYLVRFGAEAPNTEAA